MWFQHNFFKYTVGVVLVLLIILLFYEISPLLAPAINFLAVILLPIMIAGLLYYILRPSVHFLEKRRIPRYVAILIIYFFLFSMIFIVYSNLGPLIQQISEVANIPTE